MKGAFILLAGMSLIHCGGSTDTDGSGGSSGSSGSGGSSGSSATGGTGGSSGTGGGSGGVSGSGGANPDWRACNVNSDCVLRSASCCGQCGAATREDSVALNKQFVGDYSTSVCGQDVGCPACFMPQDPTILATCRGGQCEVVDLLTHPSTACAADADCQVRTTDCCECGGSTDPDHLIAISNTGDSLFSALVCDPNIGCPECEPTYPPVSMACLGGHCQLVTGN